jgi:HPt (histidine-containing phosphotransfer) domain-containing protein
MIRRLEGDEALARELMKLFLQEYAGLLQRVQAAVDAGSSERVRTAAHALKGCIGNFTDDGAYLTASEVEERGTAGALSDVPALFDRLAVEIEALAAQMREFAGEP